MTSSVGAKALAIVQWIADHLIPSRYLTAHKARLHVNRIIKHMRNDEWKELKREFVLPLQLFLPESVLEKSWKIVVKSFGQYQSADDPIITRGWLLSTIKVPLTFQDAKFGMLFYMMPWGGLVGFRLVSRAALGLGTGWKMPSYADEYARESEITLGKGDFTVPGTLCLPAAADSTAQFPCVVFLPGSGPCDRDSTIEENKPLKDLALGLASRGVASIRFDKVTLVHSRAFRKRKNITLTDEYVEYAVDAVLQGRNHPNILYDKVFILGHSLGAVVAPMIAAMDDGVAGCIILAGPAEPIYRCYIQQLEYIKSLDGPEALYIDKQIEQARKQADLADSDHLTLTTPARKLPFGIGPSYWLDYRRFKPVETVGSLGKPTCIMQGGRDYQVTVQHDYQRWHKALKDKNNVQFRFYESLNHLFISGARPSTPLEYAIPGNVDQRVVNDIADWVFGQ